MRAPSSVRAEQPDSAGVAFPFHPRQVVAPGDEVVDLFDVHASAEEPQLPLELHSAFFFVPRPDLRRDDGIAASFTEGPAQHAFGSPVHGRRVHHPRPTLDHRIDDLGGARLIRLGKVERVPRSESDDRNVDAGATESPSLHR
jgi:hypothetical protein